MKIHQPIPETFIEEIKRHRPFSPKAPKMKDQQQSNKLFHHHHHHHHHHQQQQQQQQLANHRCSHFSGFR